VRQGVPRSVPDLRCLTEDALLHKLQLMNVKNCKILRYVGAYRFLKAEQRVRTRGTALRRHRMVVRSQHSGDCVVISVDVIDRVPRWRSKGYDLDLHSIEIRRHAPTVLIYKLLHLDISEDS
jgi:hypothetical protein